MSQNIPFLLPWDILAAAAHLHGMKFGISTLDDMNHLKKSLVLWMHKQVKSTYVELPRK